MKAAPLALALVLLLGCRAAPESEAPVPVTLPKPSAPLNTFVLEVMRSYPTDGSHGFHWPKSGSWEGTTQDVVYAGHTLTTGDPERRSYCCGLTFEVYVRALLAAGAGRPVDGVSAETLHELRLRFFGDSKVAPERRRLCQFGLESLELGTSITNLEDAMAGDFVQLWRHSGSGHSAIFVNWVWKKDVIVGLTYWSTQSSTHGIGYHTEEIGPGAIKRDELFVARATWPASN